MEDELEDWKWTLAQREEDIALEMERDEDPYLIQLLKYRKAQALEKIKELSSDE